MQRTRPQVGGPQSEQLPLEQQVSSQPHLLWQRFFQLHSKRKPGMQTSSGLTFQQCFLTSLVVFLGQQMASQQPLLPLRFLSLQLFVQPAGVTSVSIWLSVVSELGCCTWGVAKAWVASSSVRQLVAVSAQSAVLIKNLVCMSIYPF